MQSGHIDVCRIFILLEAFVQVARRPSVNGCEIGPSTNVLCGESNVRLQRLALASPGLLLLPIDCIDLGSRVLHGVPHETWELRFTAENDAVYARRAISNRQIQR